MDTSNKIIRENEHKTVKTLIMCILLICIITNIYIYEDVTNYYTLTIFCLEFINVMSIYCIMTTQFMQQIFFINFLIITSISLFFTFLSKNDFTHMIIILNLLLSFQSYNIIKRVNEYNKINLLTDFMSELFTQVNPIDV